MSATNRSQSPKSEVHYFPVSDISYGKRGEVLSDFGEAGFLHAGIVLHVALSRREARSSSRGSPQSAGLGRGCRDGWWRRRARGKRAAGASRGDQKPRARTRRTTASEPRGREL